MKQGGIPDPLRQRSESRKAGVPRVVRIPELGHNIMTMKKTPHMPAGEFKAKCLSVLDRVAETKTSVIITKHGRPVAQVGPIPATTKSKPAGLIGSVKYHGDIVAPLNERWDVDS